MSYTLTDSEQKVSERPHDPCRLTLKIVQIYAKQHQNFSAELFTSLIARKHLLTVTLTMKPSDESVL
jgi:hypothetical protein